MVRVRVRVRVRLARSIVRQCAALPQTYAPPHSAASSVMRVSLESSGVPVGRYWKIWGEMGRCASR